MSVFGLNVEIAPDRVTVRRNAALSFGLLALLVPGIALLAMSFRHHHVHGTPFGVGAVCTMLGAAALVLTPWLTPSRVELTRDGLQWGRARVPRLQIISARSLVAHVSSGAYKRYASWSLVVTVAPKRALLLDFGSHSISAPPTRLVEVERAMNALLATSAR